MELLRGLIRWIIFIILLIIVIILIIKFANRTKTTKKAEPTVNVVETTNDDSNNNTEEDNNKDEDIEDGLTPIQDDLTVDSPNTASTGVRETVLGFLITCGGLIYIRKNKPIK